MKNLILTLSLILIAGCQFRVTDYPMTGYDRTSYNNPNINNSTSTKVIKLAIVAQKEKNIKPVKKILSDSFQSNAEVALSEFGNFEVLPRAEIATLMANNKFNSAMQLNAEQAKVIGADAMLIFFVNSYSIAKDDSAVNKVFKSTIFENDFHGKCNVKVTIIDIASGKKILSKMINGVSNSTATTQFININEPSTLNPLTEAIANSINDLINQLNIVYGKKSLVEQTRGSGEVAQINIGKDNGVQVGNEVEFYITKKKNGKEIIVPIGYGEIKELAPNSSWVKVINHESAGVKENHFVRLRQSY